jgi:hypothetical protein
MKSLFINGFIIYFIGISIQLISLMEEVESSITARQLL